MKWQVSVHPYAQIDMDFLRRNVPETHKRLLEKLKVVAAMSDPRCYKDIKPLRGDLEGWYRLAVYWPTPVRVIFRLMQVRGKSVIEVGSLCSIDEDNDENYIQIVRAGKRSWVYRNGCSERAVAVKKGK